MKKTRLFTSLALATILTVGATGCGGTNPTGAVPETDNSQGSAQSSTTSTEAAASDEGNDTLRVGVVSVKDLPFDSAQGGTAGIDQIGEIYDALIVGDGNGNYTPGLATSWDLNEDKTAMTLKLREGVKFSDGSDFTSEDVKFTLEYYLSDESNQGDKPNLLKYIDNIETPDDYTAVINFKAPCTEFEYWLSTNGTGAGYIYPSDYFAEVGYEAFGQNPIGTGPYILESVTPGEEIVYTVNENYWGEKPEFGKLILKSYPEESTRIAALQAGDLDFAPVNFSSSSIFDGISGLRVEHTSYSNSLTLFVYGGYENTGAALQDVRVREALSLAVNRQELVDAIFEGDAIAAGEPVVFPFTVGYTDDGSIAEYNVDKAKELLAEAGYPDNFSKPVIKLYIKGNSEVYIDDLAQALVSYWQAVGLQAEIVPIDGVELTAKIKEKPVSEDFAGSLGIFGPPKKYSAYDSLQFYASDHVYGLVQGNDKLDAAIKGLLSADGQERKDKVVEALEEIDKEHISVPLLYPGSVYIVSDKVGSFDENAGGHIGNWYYYFKKSAGNET